MRDDEEVKAELHQRVEDLKDRLWNICDNKKLDSEKERESIMNNGWLQDKTGLLTNHYITLIQVNNINIFIRHVLLRTEKKLKNQIKLKSAKWIAFKTQLVF